MEICKTGAEHIKSLHDGRAVYIVRAGARRDHASGIPKFVASQRAFTTFRPRGEHRAG